MRRNNIWDLVELPTSCKTVGCKWVFKTKGDAKGEVDIYNARLLAKGYNNREDIYYRETFSLISTKDSFHIVMAIVAHFDLELYQMNVNTTFLNGDLCEDIYTNQPDSFVENGKEHMICKLKMSIYGLKQASKQWHFKFNHILSFLNLKKNSIDRCIYLKKSGSKFVILALYVDDIFLASNDVQFLCVGRGSMIRELNRSSNKFFIPKNFQNKLS